MPIEHVLVTGGAGFIGSNVAAALARAGYRVTICDILERGEKWRNIVDIDLHDIIPPSQLQYLLLQRTLSADAVIHMGAISATTERDGDELVKNNIRLSIDLWEWSAQHSVPYIYASSAAVYGDGSAGFDDDNSPDVLARLSPLNAYGWSKLFVDRRITRDVNDGMPTPPNWAGLRFFNVYGAREEHKGSMRSVISQFLPKILSGEPVRLFRSHHPDYADGEQLRDFIHVDDCVAVILWLLDQSGFSGVFNVGTGQARSFHDLALAVYAALGNEPAIEFIDMPQEIRPNYQYFTEAKTDRLRTAGCSHIFRSLEKGAAEYVSEWLSRYGDRYCQGADLHPMNRRPRP